MECIIVSHTHWDREWYRTFQAFRARLVDMIDQVLDLLERDPGFQFLLDGQTIVLEDYLEIRPERRGGRGGVPRRRGAPARGAYAQRLRVADERYRPRAARRARRRRRRAPGADHRMAGAARCAGRLRARTLQRRAAVSRRAYRCARRQ